MARGLERSVRNLENLYSVVVAVALTFAVQQLFDLSGPGVSFRANLLPLLGAFMVTLVPFYHGAERHLEETYIEQPTAGQAGLLMLDFAYLFVEACVLVSAAALVAHVQALLVTMLCLWGLDIAWWLAQRFVTRRGGPVAAWAIINSITSVLFVVLLSAINAGWISTGSAAWLLLLVALTRSIVDYATSWSFYFPES